MNRKTSQQATLLLPANKGDNLLQRGRGNRTTAGGECEACGKLQRKAADSSGVHEVPPIVHEVMNVSGQPLDEEMRAFFEPRFGHDFSRVRVHTDTLAAGSAQALNAMAYTLGNQVVFAPGQYAPQTTAGRRLLAHELAHVVQQTERPARQKHNLEMTDPAHPAEKEAQVAAEAVMSSAPIVLTSSETPQIARQSDAGVPGGGVPLPEPEIPTPSPPPVAPAEPTLIIDQPIPGTRFTINVTPSMPAISCQARIAGITPDPTPNTDFNWQIQVTETVTPDGCASARIGNCSSAVRQEHVRGGSWMPPFSTVQGGQGVITATANVGGTELSASVAVDIRGTNPAAASITGQCGGAGADADRVACKESTRKQFDGSDNPLLGSGGDVGVMQLCNPAANCLQRWNWIENVNAGRHLLGQKRNAAINYLNHHQVGGHYPNSEGLSDADVIQREMFQRYNKGRYWEWNASMNQWEPDPINNYADNLLARC